MVELVVTRGLPASGKSTWAKQWVSISPLDRARVNRDDLRMQMFGRPAPLPYENEKQVSYAQKAMVRRLLETGTSVVVDDTNLRHRYITEWYRLTRELGVNFEVNEYFLTITPDECVRRDALRKVLGQAHGAHVGEDVIRRMALQIAGQPGWVAPPESEIVEYRYKSDPSLRSAWVVDVDGTVALMNGRGPFEWDRVGEDLANHPVCNLVRHLWLHKDLVFLSGRSEKCRDETERWLREKVFGWRSWTGELFMRAEGDMRPDEIVKLELFRDQVAPRWHVEGVLDDRDKVVAMWRRIGLLCLQVAPGAF